MLRRRLLDKLRAGSEAVISVRAPAGYGKTTALRQWAALDGRPFAWVGLDDTDDDPVALGSRLTAAIAAVQPTSVALVAVSRECGGFTGVVLPALGQQLAEVAVPFVLVLDDVQIITRPAAVRLLRFLAGSMPAGSRVVFASRSPLPIPLARLRSGVGVCEVVPADLAFARREAELFLARAGVAPAAVDAAVAAGAGWPAGLAMVAGLAVSRSGPSRRVDAGLGRDRLIVDYLREQIWAELAEPDLEFLTRTAVLPHLTGSLCDRLLGRIGSGTVLRELAAGNVPLLAVDGRDDRYRCQPLLREALLAELERRESTSVAELYGRAAAVLGADGELPAAVDAAIFASDFTVTGPLVWDAASRAVGSGSPASLREWLRPIPDRVIASSPELSAASAWAAFLIGDAAGCDRWSELAELGALRFVEGEQLGAGEQEAGPAGVRPRPLPGPTPRVSEVSAAVRMLSALRRNTDTDTGTRTVAERGGGLSKGWTPPVTGVASGASPLRWLRCSEATGNKRTGCCGRGNSWRTRWAATCRARCASR